MTLTPFASAAAADANKAATNFSLLDTSGQYHELHRNKNAKAVVVISHAVGCPIVRKLIPTINKLKSKFGDRGVRILFLNSQVGETKGLEKEIHDYSVQIPVLVDEAQLVAKLLNFTRSAEAVIIEPRTWNIVYRGPVSDAFKYESQNDQSTPFLENAIDAFLKKREIPMAKSEVMGCAISFQQPKSISYSQVIAPILIKNCIMCHSPRGGMTPTNWTDHQSLLSWSAMIREVILNKRMPPWSIDTRYGKFQDQHVLKPHEEAALISWIDQGSPRGDGKDPLQNLKQLNKSQDWAIGTPNLVLKMPQPQKIPAEGKLTYQYILVDGPTPKDIWAKAISINSDNRNVVHHAAVHILPQKIENYPNPEKYLDGMLLNFDREASLVHLSGKYGEPIEFPKDTAYLIPKGSYIYLEIHYLPSGRPEVDNTKIGIHFYKNSKPKRSVGRYIFADIDFKIPPNESHHKIAISKDVDDVELIGLFAHMHYRGKSASFVATYPDGKSEILLSIPRYNYNWHRFYMLSEPKKIPRGTKLTLHLAYDNSSENPDNPDPKKSVQSGAYDTDEMAFGVAVYTKPANLKSKK